MRNKYLKQYIWENYKNQITDFTDQQRKNDIKKEPNTRFYIVYIFIIGDPLEVREASTTAGFRLCMSYILSYGILASYFAQLFHI